MNIGLGKDHISLLNRVSNNPSSFNKRERENETDRNGENDENKNQNAKISMSDS